MSNAHRPTWAPAMGGKEQGGSRFFAGSRMQSAKDQPSQLTMKTRQPGQASADEVSQRDLRAELEAKERKHFKLDRLEEFEEAKKNDLKLLQAAPDTTARPMTLVPNARDADDADADESGSGSDSDDDDEDEDLEALQAELERIKAERAAEKAKKDAEAAQQEEEERREELLRSNPMLRQELGIDAGPAFGVKRRWDDDVVFKNQARTEPKKQKRFINDTVRSDFHRRFLDRYIK